MQVKLAGKPFVTDVVADTESVEFRVILPVNFKELVVKRKDHLLMIGWKTNFSILLTLCVILDILGKFLYLFSTLNTIPGPLKHSASVILIKYDLKQLLISSLSDMIVVSYTRSNFSLGRGCSEKKDLNVFQNCLLCLHQ